MLFIVQCAIWWSIFQPFGMIFMSECANARILSLCGCQVRHTTNAFTLYVSTKYGTFLTLFLGKCAKNHANSSFILNIKSHFCSQFVCNIQLFYGPFEFGVCVSATFSHCRCRCRFPFTFTFT